MSSLPLLKATLLEMERLFPTAAVLSRVVGETFEFAGYELTKGTKVLHLQTIPHFLEEIYEEPYQFNPGRWIDREYSKKAQGSFGGSTHICLGVNLVRIHMLIVVANLLRDYELRLAKQAEILIILNYGVPQAATKFVAHKVSCDAAEFDANDRRELFLVYAAQERIDAGDEFIGIEGFYQIVIVRADLESIAATDREKIVRRTAEVAIRASNGDLPPDKVQ